MLERGGGGEGGGVYFYIVHSIAYRYVIVPVDLLIDFYTLFEILLGFFEDVATEVSHTQVVE